MYSKEQISDFNWHVFHVRRRSPLFVYSIFHGVNVDHIEGFHSLVDVCGGCCNYMLARKETYAEYGNAIWKKSQEEPELLISEYEKAYEKNKKDVLIWRELKQRDFSNHSIGELYKEYKNYSNSLLSYGKYIFVPLAIEHLFENAISKLIDGFEEHKRNEYYDIIMTPVRESSVVQERRSLLNLKILKNLGNIEEFEKGLELHIEKFSFLKKKGFVMDFYSKEFYIEQMEKINDPKKELDLLNQSAKKRENDFSNLLDSFEDLEVKNLIKSTNESIYFRSWRSERLIQSSFYIISLFEEFSKRFDLSEAKDMIYLYPFEVEKLINGKLPEYKKTIEKRKDAFCYLTLGIDGHFLLDGEDAKEFCKTLNIFKKDDSLKGIPAYKGKVRGRVTLVHNDKDYPKMKSAEVIVVGSTIPEMVPYLKDVKAIIAEEGGILSHAAVISREFRIPSILGVGLATKVLNDGDLVEVDAIEGRIKIIERK